MLTNTSKSYGWVAIAFHWLTALAVLGLFALGWWMVGLDYYSAWYQDAPDIHKSVGILLAALIVFRLIWKATQTKPQPLGSKLEITAAQAAHLLLYGLLFCLFVTGYLIPTGDGRAIDVFNWFSVPSLGELIADQEDVAGFIHEYLAYALIGLTAVHALAALKHHFVNKDRTLTRILKP